MEKGYTINALDHGYVKYIDHLGNDETVIESARMSTNKGFQGWDKDINLLDYLYRNHHMSPFEMCELIVEVKVPLFVAREWHRHRTFAYNELSARYAQMPDEHYLPIDRLTKQSKTNNQSSSDETFPDEFINGAITDFKEEQELIYENYSRLLYNGVAKEIARINTPVSRYTKFRAKANLRNWFHFLDLRMRESAQYEIRVYANVVASIIKELFPRSYNLFEEYDLYAENMSKSEIQLLKQLASSLQNIDTYRQALQNFGISDPNRLDQCVEKIYGTGK